MPELSQEGSPLKIHTVLGPNTLIATAFQGRESLNNLYHFAVELVASRHTEVPFQRLVGSDARLELNLPEGGLRYFHGIISEFSALGHEQDFAYYRATITPPLHRLAFTKRSRAFQEMDIPQILAQVLAPVGGAKFRLDGPGLKRDYLVQYRETDLEFFQRVCSEEGLSFFWNHSEEGATLLVVDRTSIGDPLGSIPFLPSGQLAPESSHLRDWELTQRLGVSSVAVQGSNFQLFDRPIDGRTVPPAHIAAGNQSLTPQGSLAPSEEDHCSQTHLFDQIKPSGAQAPEGLTNIFEFQEGRAKVAATAASAASIRAKAVGNCPSFQPGHTFQLDGHPTQNGSWLVVDLEHKVIVEGRYWLAEKVILKNLQTLHSSPLLLEQKPWPPRPKPVIAGFLNAIVIGPEGQDTFVDSFGRVQLRFLWERGDALAKVSSCWVRVSQSWAGRGYGAFFWPRIGNEVVVAFEGGDPDRPLVVGSVYNSRNSPPLSLPGNAMSQGFRTSQGGHDSISPSHTFILADAGTDPVILLQASTAVILHQNRMHQSSTPNTIIEMLG